MLRPFVLLTAAFVISGCGRAQLSSSEASHIAADLANRHCKHQFGGASPFQPSLSTAQLIDGQWHWTASAGFGHGDLAADVTFSRSGENPSVRVQLLDNRPSLRSKAFIRTF